MPFEYFPETAEDQHFVPHYKIDTTRREVDGKQLYKTPQIRAASRVIDPNQLRSMKNVMIGQGLQ